MGTDFISSNREWTERGEEFPKGNRKDKTKPNIGKQVCRFLGKSFYWEIIVFLPIVKKTR